ncbi:MAG: phosphoribosyltransferase [Candidatus ainarchaeum sp.]|nr:phosphoribosyltransferase [Candidatus ainarchaeum sp.]
MVKFIKPNWNEIEKMCKALSKKIEQEFKPDIIVSILRGGMVPARIFSDLLHNRNVASMRVEFYSGIEKTKKEPIISQTISCDVKNKRILLVDDVSDSGYSMKKAVEYLKEKNPSEIRTVAIHYKPKSIFKPDYFYEETEAWIIYPWEKEETKKEIGKNEK